MNEQKLTSEHFKSMKHSFEVELNGGTKLSIDPTIEIKFDESTKFNQKELMKMTEEEFIKSDFYKRMFESIPTVSMKVFRWFRHSECPYKRVAFS